MGVDGGVMGMDGKWMGWMGEGGDLVELRYGDGWGGMGDGNGLLVV